MAGLAFMLALFTAFVSDHLVCFFLISIATTGLVMYSFWKYNWWKAMVFILMYRLSDKSCSGCLLILFR